MFSRWSSVREASRSGPYLAHLSSIYRDFMVVSILYLSVSKSTCFPFLDRH